MSDLQINHTLLLCEEDISALQKLQHLRSALAKLDSHDRHSEHPDSVGHCTGAATF